MWIENFLKRFAELLILEKYIIIFIIIIIIIIIIVTKFGFRLVRYCAGHCFVVSKR